MGTTYSCVGVWESERVEIIANEQGNRTTPSYVAFSDNERLVGDAAKNQAAMNPKNTVFDAKRLIGRRFDDQEVKADMKNWPFTVVEKETNPFIQVEFEGETKTYSPQGKNLLFFFFLGWDYFDIIGGLFTNSPHPCSDSYNRDLLHGLDQDEGNR